MAGSITLFVTLVLVLIYHFAYVRNSNKHHQVIKKNMALLNTNHRVAVGTLIAIANEISENPKQDAETALEDIRNKEIA